MLPYDTSQAAAAFHEEALRRLGPSGRFKIALELSDLSHALAVAAIRRRHPEYNDDQACQELAHVLYGAKM
jgi:hypothetical protein